MAEPMGCVLNGLNAAGVDGVSNALVVGAGPIGLLLALALRSKSSTEIAVADIQESRLELASSFGLDTIKAEDLNEEHWSKAFDLVIDATGVAAVASNLIDYCTSGGTVLLFGVCDPASTIAVSPFELFRRQVRILGAHSLNHNIHEALRAIRDIGPDIARLVSHRLPLEEIPKFLEGSQPGGTLKVQAIFR